MEYVIGGGFQVKKGQCIKKMLVFKWNTFYKAFFF